MAKRKQEEVAKDMESVKVSHTETDEAPKAGPKETKDLAAVSSLLDDLARMKSLQHG